MRLGLIAEHFLMAIKVIRYGRTSDSQLQVSFPIIRVHSVLIRLHTV